jgi:hypothetical protein
MKKNRKHIKSNLKSKDQKDLNTITEVMTSMAIEVTDSINTVKIVDTTIIETDITKIIKSKRNKICTREKKKRRNSKLNYSVTKKKEKGQSL